jgi:hypothetical protein
MRFAFFAPLLVLCFGGCLGYKIGPIKPTWMKDINKIAVHTFRNDTLEPRIEVDMANAVIKQFQQDGTVQIVQDKDADAILDATVDMLSRRPARTVITNVLQTQEFTLQVRGRFTLTKKDTGVVIDSRAVVGQTSFYTSGSGSVAEDVLADERQAVPLAAEDMATQLVSAYTEGW